MGRMAAHTGRIITYEQMLNCDHEFAPGLEKITMDGPAPLVADAKGRYPVPQPGIVTDREYAEPRVDSRLAGFVKRRDAVAISAPAADPNPQGHRRTQVICPPLFALSLGTPASNFASHCCCDVPPERSSRSSRRSVLNCWRSDWSCVRSVPKPCGLAGTAEGPVAICWSCRRPSRRESAANRPAASADRPATAGRRFARSGDRWPDCRNRCWSCRSFLLPDEPWLPPDEPCPLDEPWLPPDEPLAG